MIYDDDGLEVPAALLEAKDARIRQLESRVHDLEQVLAKMEDLLARRDAHASATLHTLDEVIQRLTAEGHSRPPRPWHPSDGAS